MAKINKKNIEYFIINVNKEFNKYIVEPKKRVIYTANFGGYDLVREPLVTEENCDYICFTDVKSNNSNIWLNINISTNGIDPRLCSRLLKHLPHYFLTLYEQSIWVDSKYQIIGKQNHYWSSSANFIVYKHQIRNRVYQELIACSKIGNDNILLMLKQYIGYVAKGFRDCDDLIRSCVVYRRHNERDIVKFQDSWFDEINNNSIRDQLSFNYLAQENNFKYELTPISIFNEIYHEVGHLVHGVYNDNGVFVEPLQRKIHRFRGKFYKFIGWK